MLTRLASRTPAKRHTVLVSILVFAASSLIAGIAQITIGRWLGWHDTYTNAEIDRFVEPTILFICVFAVLISSAEFFATRWLTIARHTIIAFAAATLASACGYFCALLSLNSVYLVSWFYGAVTSQIFAVAWQYSRIRIFTPILLVPMLILPLGWYSYKLSQRLPEHDQPQFVVYFKTEATGREIGLFWETAIGHRTSRGIELLDGISGLGSEDSYGYRKMRLQFDRTATGAQREAVRTAALGSPIVLKVEEIPP